MLSALPALLWAQLPEQGALGTADPARGGTKGSGALQAQHPTPPGTEPGLARQQSGTGGMEPGHTMAELIRASADGKGHGPHTGRG